MKKSSTEDGSLFSSGSSGITNSLSSSSFEYADIICLWKSKNRQSSLLDYSLRRLAGCSVTLKSFLLVADKGTTTSTPIPDDVICCARAVTLLLLNSQTYMGQLKSNHGIQRMNHTACVYVPISKIIKAYEKNCFCGTVMLFVIIWRKRTWFRQLLQYCALMCGWNDNHHTAAAMRCMQS